MSKPAHNPTAAELDERFSLYGLNPEDVGKAIVHTEMKTTEPVKPRKRRTPST